MESTTESPSTKVGKEKKKKDKKKEKENAEVCVRRTLSYRILSNSHRSLLRRFLSPSRRRVQRKRSGKIKMATPQSMVPRTHPPSSRRNLKRNGNMQKVKEARPKSRKKRKRRSASLRLSELTGSFSISHCTHSLIAHHVIWFIIVIIWYISSLQAIHYLIPYHRLIKTATR